MEHASATKTQIFADAYGIIHQGYDYSMHGLYIPAISLSIGALETPHHPDNFYDFVPDLQKEP